MIGELKPCPFCGGEAGYAKAGWFKGTPSEYADWVMIICERCLCSTESYESIEELAELWNKRSDVLIDHKGLKSCPHCGGKARVFMLRGGNYKVECNTSDNSMCCHTSPGYTADKKQIVAAWNRRVHDE